jgi:hypothetical protein
MDWNQVIPVGIIAIMALFVASIIFRGRGR